jgi:formyl-CoA transferase
MDGRPEMGRKMFPGPSWKMSDTPGKVRSPAPSLGEHNHYVFSELLGLSEDEIAKLEAEEVIPHNEEITPPLSSR